MAEFFGFEINRKGTKKPERPSFVPDTESDGAGVIQSGGHFGVYLDVDGDKVKTENELIMRYRDIAAQPECDAAVEDIVNEPIRKKRNAVEIFKKVENIPDEDLDMDIFGDKYGNLDSDFLGKIW